MAVLAAAALLDELMGRNRNVLPNEKVKELNWEDPEYCKYFLVKFCPHDLFVNTKADLGTCPKVHDEEVRKLFEKGKGHRKIQYQEEFIRFCTSMVNEVERKIQKGRQRLALNSKQEITPSNPAQIQRNQEQINILNERINGLEKEAEQAGNDGNVEQAQGLMKLCDQLKEERDVLKKQNENGHWSATAELAAAQEKQMEVCEVCGAFLIVGDAQQRIDDHLMGKQHVGYARLKMAIDEVTASVQSARDERRGVRVDDRKDREKVKEVDREREKSERRREAESNERERPHKEHRDRSEHRSSGDRRDKEKEKKERERREKEERRERDRERDKQRDRERERRHRDRERDRDTDPEEDHLDDRNVEQDPEEDHLDDRNVEQDPEEDHLDDRNVEQDPEEDHLDDRNVEQDPEEDHLDDRNVEQDPEEDHLDDRNVEQDPEEDHLDDRNVEQDPEEDHLDDRNVEQDPEEDHLDDRNVEQDPEEDHLDDRNVEQDPEEDHLDDRNVEQDPEEDHLDDRNVEQGRDSRSSRHSHHRR